MTDSDLQPDERAREFDSYRGVLLGAAYRVLGSMTDAEDVVQEVWLRWSAVDRREVRDARGYLVRIATRLALNSLRHRVSLREEYAGPWLPEPVGDTRGDDAAEVAESVSLAMLVVLESLSPLERAAFVLREVFDEPFEEIAGTLDRTPAAVRQLVHRAREHVRARAPRHPVDPATHRRVAEQFLSAMQGGSMDELLALLAPDVRLITDGGGIKSAALRPIVGPEKVLRFFAGILEKNADSFSFAISTVNGEPSIVAAGPDGVDTVGMIRIDDGVVTELYAIRNPSKLSRIPPPETRQQG